MPEPPTRYLETPRLLLRFFTPADADNLIELDSDPLVMRYLTNGVPTSADEVRGGQIPRVMAFHERTPHMGFFATEEIASGRFIGWFHFRPAHDEPHDTELGYRLRRDAWGQGYATEGSRALLRKGFAEMGLPRVIARTLLANTASAEVMRKVGMRHVRDFIETRFSGDDKRAVEYAITAEEWHALERTNAS